MCQNIIQRGVGQAGAWLRSFPRVGRQFPKLTVQLRSQSTTPDWRKSPDSPGQHGWHSGAAVGVQKPRKCVYFEPPNWFTISHLFVQSPDGFDTWP